MYLNDNIINNDDDYDGLRSKYFFIGEIIDCDKPLINNLILLTEYHFYGKCI